MRPSVKIFVQNYSGNLFSKLRKHLYKYILYQCDFLCVCQLCSYKVLDRSQQNYDRRSYQGTRAHKVTEQNYSHHNLQRNKKT